MTSITQPDPEERKNLKKALASVEAEIDKLKAEKRKQENALLFLANKLSRLAEHAREIKVRLAFGDDDLNEKEGEK